MKNIRLLLLCLGATSLLSSCATLFSGRRADVVVYSDVPQRVSIRTNVTSYDSVALPCVVQVDRRHLRDSVFVSSSRYSHSAIVPESKLNPMIFVNLLHDGLGILVDLATGSSHEPKQLAYFTTSTPKMSGDRVERVSMQEQVDQMVNAIKYPAFYRHEVGGAFGLGSRIWNNTYYDDLEKKMMTEYHMEYDHMCFYLGGYSLGGHYYYHLNRRWAVGLLAGMIVERQDFFLPKDAPGGHPVFRYPGSIFSSSLYVMPAAKFSIYTFPNMTVYAKGGLGMQRVTVYYDGDDSSHRQFERSRWQWAGQLSGGMEFGRGHLRSFVEIGAGSEGVFRVGISGHFGH